MPSSFRRGDDKIPYSLRGVVEPPTSSGVKYPELEVSSSMKVVSSIPGKKSVCTAVSGLRLAVKRRSIEPVGLADKSHHKQSLALTVC